MTKLESRRDSARQLLRAYGVPLGVDFHTLRQKQVHGVLCAARDMGYKTPKGANGSRARYFYEYAMRGAEGDRIRKVTAQVETLLSP